MLHLHSTGLIVNVHKTARTACGRTVKFSDLAITSDADCPQCVDHAKAQHTMLRNYRDSMTDLDTIRSEHTREVCRLIDAGPQLRNAIYGGAL